MYFHFFPSLQLSIPPFQLNCILLHAKSICRNQRQNIPQGSRPDTPLRFDPVGTISTLSSYWSGSCKSCGHALSECHSFQYSLFAYSECKDLWIIMNQNTTLQVILHCYWILASLPVSTEQFCDLFTFTPSFIQILSHTCSSFTTTTVLVVLFLFSHLVQTIRCLYHS